LTALKKRAEGKQFAGRRAATGSAGWRAGGMLIAINDP
jgi:hypothetical protein